MGVLIGEIALLIPHLVVGAPVEESFWLLALVTVVSAVIWLLEASRFKKKQNNLLPYSCFNSGTLCCLSRTKSHTLVIAH